MTEMVKGGKAMHGVVIDVKVDSRREGEARRMVREMIVPKARAHAGFAAGYWLRALDGDVIRSVHLYDSEDAARAAAEAIRSEGPPPGAPVTLESIDTYEVLAHA
jgi:hypothetical protein